MPGPETLSPAGYDDLDLIDPLVKDLDSIGTEWTPEDYGLLDGLDPSEGEGSVWGDEALLDDSGWSVESSPFPDALPEGKVGLPKKLFRRFASGARTAGERASDVVESGYSPEVGEQLRRGLHGVIGEVATQVGVEIQTGPDGKLKVEKVSWWKALKALLRPAKTARRVAQAALRQGHREVRDRGGDIASQVAENLQ